MPQVEQRYVVVRMDRERFWIYQTDDFKQAFQWLKKLHPDMEPYEHGEGFWTFRVRTDKPEAERKDLYRIIDTEQTGDADQYM